MAEKTIETYTTRGFKNEGVAGSTPVRMTGNKGKDAITPQVMKENNMPSKHIVGNRLKNVAVGNGVDSQKPVSNAKGGKSAGNVGSSNVNHS